MDKSIEEKFITYYEYLGFENFQPIGNGSYGSVVRANRNTGQFYAVKSFNNDKITLKEVVNEVLAYIYYFLAQTNIKINNQKSDLLIIFLLQIKLHQTVNNHENIVKFYGVTKKNLGNVS